MSKFRIRRFQANDLLLGSSSFLFFLLQKINKQKSFPSFFQFEENKKVSSFSAVIRQKCNLFFFFSKNLNWV